MPIGNITQTVSTIPAPPHRGVDVQSIFVTKQEDFQDHLAETTIDELNTLKDQLNTRIGEINSTTTTINGYADTASAGASIATTKAGEASTSASEALTSRNQAETFKNNASTSATKASQWADNNYNVEVETGRYSAKHWSVVAENAVGDLDQRIDTLDITTVKLTGNQTIAGVKTFNSSPTVPTPTADTQATNKAYVDIATDRIGLIDYGYVAKNYHIVAFGGEFNRADYPKLWAYLQANPALVKTQAQWQTEATANGGICGFFSSGNGTTTFRVPNLDKAFLRPDSRGVGSYQDDMFKSHNHGVGNSYGAVFSGGSTNSYMHPSGTYVNTSYEGGTETRPKNIAVLPLIVAK